MNRAAPCRHWHSSLAVSLALLVPLAHAAAPAPAGPKTHTLYMGADLSLATASGVLLPVRDVRNNSFVAIKGTETIMADGREREFQLKIDRALKLSAGEVRVDGVAYERCYSPDNDPMTHFRETSRTSAYMNESLDDANTALRHAESVSGYAGAVMATMPAEAGAETRASAANAMSAAQGMVTSAQARSDAAAANARMQVFDTVSNSVKLTNALAAEAYDAIHVSLTLSTPLPLENPYVVLMVRFFADPEKPETANVWVYAERVPDLDGTPRTFHIRRAGFPPGYKIDDCQMHLYDAGKEVATSVSPKRVELTTDEAFLYVVSEYVGSHRGATNRPLKARDFWPSDLPSRLTSEKLSQTLYVKVGKDGRATGIFEDEDCRRAVTAPGLTELVPELHFLPALAQGKPIDSVAAVRLADRS